MHLTCELYSVQLEEIGRSVTARDTPICDPFAGCHSQIFEPACEHAQTPVALQEVVAAFATTIPEGVCIRRSGSKTVKPAMHYKNHSLIKCCSMEDALRQHFHSESVCDGSFLEHVEGLLNTGKTDLPFFQECKTALSCFSFKSAIVRSRIETWSKTRKT